MDDVLEEKNTMVDQAPLTPTIAAEPKVQGKAMTMDFPDAMREVIKGKKVARAEWGNFDYGFLKSEFKRLEN